VSAIHTLIYEHGKEEALRRATPSQRHLVNIAAEILAESSDATGFTYSGFCQAALPHKRLPDDKEWIRQSERLTLMIEPGRMPIPGQNEARFLGVPFGSRARLILLYLQTEALRTKSRHVELGGSMREWLRRMGVSPGGKTFREVREQATRLSTCKLSFYWPQSGGMGFSNERIVDGGILFNDPADDRQGSLFADTVRLSESFYNALRKHPVPLWEPAIRQLQNNSMALDLYVWLSYRLHVLKKPTPIHWPRLHEQFGSGFKAIRQFKPTFIANLELALTVYPEAIVEPHDQGLVLVPSRPPIPERLIA
jgi:Plasmid encoded RepA protein